MTSSTDPGAGETVLFELRVTPHGVEVFESDAWRAYHHHRREPFRVGALPSRPRRAHAQRALDTLQALYDDLYGATPADAEAS